MTIEEQGIGKSADILWAAGDPLPMVAQGYTASGGIIEKLVYSQPEIGIIASVNGVDLG